MKLIYTKIKNIHNHIIMSFNYEYDFSKNTNKKVTFTDEEKTNKEEFYWKLLHYKLFGDFYGIEMKKIIYDSKTFKSRTERTCMDKYFGVNSDDYLIKNEFEFKGESCFSDLWEYLKYNENVILAGGYITSILFDIKFFPNSDIDLFVRKDKVMEVIDFIRDNFNVIRYEKLCSVIINIVLDGMRNIQIIVKEFDKVSHLLDDFDMCHSKCAFYMGNTYHTYDAKYAKEHKVTMSFQNVRVDRSEKAKKYGLELFNSSLYERVPKEKGEFINYYDFRNSCEFLLIEKNVVVFADNYDPDFFNDFGSSYDCTHNYNFDFYEFSDKILYKEININDIENIDLTNIIIKPTRYNYSHYCNCYKMVQFNEYFKVPCILYFITQVDYGTVKKERNYVQLIDVKDYKTIYSNIDILFRKIYDASSPITRKIYKYLHEEDCISNNKISISTHYNDVEFLENKTGEKLCLIIDNRSNESSEVLFNLFPSSVNF